MKVELHPEQQALIHQAIKDGRVGSTEDAVQEALQLWEKRERRRGEILAAVDEAEVSLSRGQGVVMNDESMRDLAEEVKRRGRARLEADRQARLMALRLAPQAAAEVDEIWYYVAQESGNPLVADRLIDSISHGSSYC